MMARPTPAMIAVTATIAALGLGSIWATAARADAEPGDLDTSFGGNGMVATAFTSFGGAFATDVATRANRIAAVGGDGGGRFALGIYNLDGSLRFDRVTTNFGGSDTAHAVAITPGLGIVAAGATDPPGGGFNGRLALARYFGDGTLNPTFGDGGMVVTPIDDQAEAHDVAIQPDGKLVAVGYSIDDGLFSGDLRFAVTRYNPDGTLDAGFDGNGIRVDTIRDQAVAQAVAIQPDGRVVTAGFGGPDGEPNRFVLIRHHPNGSLDPTFAGDGRQLTAFGAANAVATAVAIQPDGKIVAAGRADDKLALARYLPNGQLDPAFGDGGRVATSIGTGADRAEALAIQPDGKILAAGRTAQGGGNVALARYLPNGQLDPAFGGDGRVITGAGGDESAGGIAIQGDGRIVIAGETSTGEGRFLLARYHAEPFDDSAPETTLSGPGGAIADPEPSFELSSSEPGASFECELDGAGFAPCSSPHAVGPLADGPHSLRARAVDGAGNTDPTPAELSFTVDTSIVLSLDTRGRQRVGRLAVRVGCGEEACEAKLGGKVVVRKARTRKFMVRPKTIALAAGEQTSQRVRFEKNRRSVRKLRRLLKLNVVQRRTNAKLTVTAADRAGNTAAERVRVKLER